MPTYVYQASDTKKSCKTCGKGFEIEQSIKDDPLRKCPDCGSPIRRVITGANISTGPSTKSLLSDKNIKRHGFTKLVNEGDGKFRKI